MPPVTTTRPATDEEQALLAREPFKQFGSWTGIPGSVAVFFIAFLIVSVPAPLLGFGLAVGVAFTAAIVASVVWYAKVQRRARGEFRAAVARAARERTAGVVQSTVYTITDAIACGEFEDEGFSYYLLLDDGRTLFLTGQYLYDPVDAGFPWRSFEMVRVPPEHWVLRVVPLGPRLEPGCTLPPWEGPFAPDAIPEDGSIAQRDFAALKVRAS